MNTAFRILCFSICIVFVHASSYAFNKDRCSKLFPTFDDDHPPYASPIYVSTMVPSTTSYFSSLGPCAMYGKGGVVARRFYIEDSMDEIQVAVAQGQGEHLYALAEYSGCPQAAHREFASELRANYLKLFALPRDSHQLGLRIDRIIHDGPLGKKCIKLN